MRERGERGGARRCGAGSSSVCVFMTVGAGRGWRRLRAVPCGGVWGPSRGCPSAAAGLRRSAAAAVSSGGRGGGAAPSASKVWHKAGRGLHLAATARPGPRFSHTSSGAARPSRGRGFLGRWSRYHGAVRRSSSDAVAKQVSLHPLAKKAAREHPSKCDAWDTPGTG